MTQETSVTVIDYPVNKEMFVLRDTIEEHIDFHIEAGDYFNFLATVIGLFEERLAEASDAEHERALAKKIRCDLRYVNATYKIIPKAD
jgi:hypothetical protein